MTLAAPKFARELAAYEKNKKALPTASRGW